MNYGPRRPLHMQSTTIAKAAAKGSASYESFRPNVVHPSGNYQKDMPKERATVEDEFRLRRYPNGQLDYHWTAGQIIDALHKMKFNGTTGNPNEGSAGLIPLECALLTVVFPTDYRKIEPMQAEIMTKLSDSEKEALRILVIEQMAQESTWNAGQGGGSVPGTHPRDAG